MSFFLKKRSRTSLTSSERPKSKQGNTDFIRGGRKRVKASSDEYVLKKQKQEAIKERIRRRRSENDRNKLPHTGKRARFDPNEEIESSEDEDDIVDGLYENGINSRLLPDNEAADFSEEDASETPQDKKIRLAKEYLKQIESEERKKEEDEEVDLDLKIAQRLREDILEAEGRMRREVASSISYDPSAIFTLTNSRHLKKSVTCLCISPDDKFIYSACKDGNLFKWSVESKEKVGMVRRKEKLSKKQIKRGEVLKSGKNENECHSSTITAIAISSDGKFLATGDLEKQVVIWDPTTLKRIHIFTGHRGAIRGLVFRQKTHTLFSCSDDRSVRIWSIDEMGYVETLFGHQDAVTSIDALSRERAISSGGRDASIRVWKILEESQLVYNAKAGCSIDVVKLINEENFVSGGDDGGISLWNVNRKKPLCTAHAAHGFINSHLNEIKSPMWISAVGAWNNTDLVASGSGDGVLRLWACGDHFKSLHQVLEVPIQGWANSIAFSHANEEKFIVVGIGKEHKSGRWCDNIKGAKNSIVVIPLRTKLLENGLSGEISDKDKEIESPLISSENKDIDPDELISELVK